MMDKKKKELAYALASVTQLGISVIVSFMIWIFLALWLKKIFSLGNFIVVTGVFFGAGSAGMSFYNFWRKTCNIAAKKENNNENN